VENLLKSRTARLGRHHPDLQLDRLVQDRWPASMVGSAAANLLSDLLYHPLDRSREKLRKRCRLCDRPDLSVSHIFPYPGIWQRNLSRAISGTEAVETAI